MSRTNPAVRPGRGRTAALLAVANALAVVAALAALAAASSCAPRAPAEPQPADALRDWAAALEKGDAASAWDLLDPALRGDWTREEFAAWMERNRAELLEQARAALTAATSRPTEMRAVVRVGREDVSVVREADGWRLAAPYWPAPPAATPAATLRALHDALGRGDLATARDALLGGAARSELDRLVAALGAAAAAAPDSPDPPDPEARELTVPLDGGGAVTLTRDGPRWRVTALRLPGPPATTAPGGVR